MNPSLRTKWTRCDTREIALLASPLIAALWYSAASGLRHGKVSIVTKTSKPLSAGHFEFWLVVTGLYHFEVPLDDR